jgi:hypothetical protein
MLQMINFDNVAGQTHGPNSFGISNAKTSTDFYQHTGKKDKEVHLPKVKDKKMEHSHDPHTDSNLFEDREPKM